MIFCLQINGGDTGVTCATSSGGTLESHWLFGAIVQKNVTEKSSGTEQT